MPRPPMVAVIGKKHSGKTTLTVQLAAELRRRGYRVMTIKHGSHTFNIDPATTDTYRHYHEGHAEKVAMVAPDKFALIERWSDERTPEDIAERYMSDADVVVCEGFKASALPKIEVYRRAAHAEPLYRAGSTQAPHYLAIITDSEDLDVDVPVIRFADADWLARVAALVEQTVMGRRPS
ncbi:MAG TPA: molybdopterin-guanine dinucleotide biosynthesis protein B [Gemmatimonadaceae bacterium]|nr:molybdopterin-guanine dinucleotide biosynthesis protein B [Gemmatimonadaceae bacterium]